MVRPHPAVWRFIHGVLVCYLLSLVFLLFQDVGSARQLLRVRRLPAAVGFSIARRVGAARRLTHSSVGLWRGDRLALASLRGWQHRPDGYSPIARRSVVTC